MYTLTHRYTPSQKSKHTLKQITLPTAPPLPPYFSGACSLVCALEYVCVYIPMCALEYVCVYIPNVG